MEQFLAAVSRAVRVLAVRCVLSQPPGWQQRSGRTSSGQEVCLQTAGGCLRVLAWLKDV